MTELMNMMDAVMQWAQSFPRSTAMAFFVWVNVLDVLSTGYVLSLGGREVNPVARWAMDWARSRGYANELGLLALKAVVIVGLLALGVDGAVLMLMALILLGVVAWNMWTGRRLRAAKDRGEVL